MQRDRGFMIAEAVSAMAHEYYLRDLARQRDRRMAQKRVRQRKEADTAATVTTSRGLTANKTYKDYTNKQEECQDVKFDPPDNS